MCILRSGIELDDADRALIGELQQDGRMPFVELARKLGISERTARSRVSGLLENGVIHVVALTNPRALGFNAICLLGVTTDPAVPVSQIAKEIARVSDVDYVVVTTGRYGIIVEVISTDRAAMLKTIETRIGTIAGIRSIEIFPGLSLYYQKARFLAGMQGATGVRPTLLPETDRQIALTLSTNGRMPFRAVAERVGISETQVRARVSSMLETRQMSILAIMNPLAFPERCVAWVGMKIAPGSRSQEVADAISHEDTVSYVVISGGRFDLFVELICENEEHLHQVLESRIRAIPQISSFEIFIYLDLHYKVLGVAHPPQNGAGGTALEKTL